MVEKKKKQNKFRKIKICPARYTTITGDLLWRPSPSINHDSINHRRSEPPSPSSRLHWRRITPPTAPLFFVHLYPLHHPCSPPLPNIPASSSQLPSSTTTKNRRSIISPASTSPPSHSPLLAFPSLAPSTTPHSFNLRTTPPLLFSSSNPAPLPTHRNTTRTGVLRRRFCSLSLLALLCFFRFFFSFSYFFFFV